MIKVIENNLTAHKKSVRLYKRLEYHYKGFNINHLKPDPLQFLHLYKNPEDIEVIGLISSVMAYGNVKQIISTLEKVTAVTGSSPFNFILNFSSKKDGKRFTNIRHRFYTYTDLIRFFEILKDSYREYSSLQNLFSQNFNRSDENIKNGLNAFSKYFKDNYRRKFGLLSRGFSFMFPTPEKNSACKRLNLFLRWMVRKDELDFGIWKNVKPNQLVIPVDTHIARISGELGLTQRATVSWQMAEEITNNLKLYDPVDPVKYDFAICHIGIRKLNF